MIVSIHQPNYIPWLGLIDQIYHCDKYVFLDDVMYSNTGDHNRNKIKGSSGIVRLSVPVEQHMGDIICNVRTRDELKWKEKHLKTLEMSYKRAPHFQEVFAEYSDLLCRSYPNLAEMNESIIMWMTTRFGIEREFIKSSDLHISTVKEERVLDICEKLNADTYLSGNGARAYQDINDFTNRGLQLRYQSYQPIVYPQLWGDFIPNLSALDYIMNCGFVLPSEITK